MGSPETVYVSHKAKALCYNTVSLLPERLIRAPVLKPRPRSRAGGSAANVCLMVTFLGKGAEPGPAL